MLLGQQDAQDGYPAGVEFHSVAAVRNLDTIPVKVSPTVKFLRSGNVETTALAPFNLKTGESRVLDLNDLQKKGQIPADARQASLELAPDSGHNSLVAELFNFNEKTKGYVVGSSFFAYPSRSTGSVWRTDGTFQTTVMVENTSDQADQVSLRMFSNQSAYVKTFPIGTGELLKINVVQLQQNRIPDDQGRLLTGTSGTMAIVGSNGVQSKLAFDKVIHSADEADYVGLVSNPCDYVNALIGFLDGGSSPFEVWIESDWVSGDVTDSPAGGTVSKNPNWVQISSGASGDLATVTPVDGSSHTAELEVIEVVEDCDQCTGGPISSLMAVPVPPKPGFLQMVSISNNRQVCLGTGCEADVRYRVLDVNGITLAIAGMIVHETVTAGSGNTCDLSGVSDSATWTTDPSGTLTMVDQILLCPIDRTSTCRAMMNQTFTVNGFPVQVFSQNGAQEGTHNVITVTVNNGNVTCPTIVPTP